MSYTQKNLDEASKDENKTSEKGITKDRSCTDILFCLIFVAFIAGMVALSIVGFKRGDPLKLLHPFDTDGYACG